MQSQREGLSETVQEIKTRTEEREKQLTSQHHEEREELQQQLYTLTVKVRTCVPRTYKTILSFSRSRRQCEMGKPCKM